MGLADSSIDPWTRGQFNNRMPHELWTIWQELSAAGRHEWIDVHIAPAF